MNILISVPELQSRLNDPVLKILHVHMAPVGSAPGASGPGPQEFIPGAVVFDIEAMSDETSPLPHTALPMEEFARRVRTLGIDSGNEIVVYDEKGIYSSPRARALFRAAGHERVRVLDGGLPEWKRMGNGTVRIPASVVRSGDFFPRPAEFRLLDRAEVARAIDQKNAVILDARSEERFKGVVDEPRAGLRRGHIPTACSMPFTKVLDGALLKSKSGLEMLFGDLVKPDLEVIVYCGSGVTACIVALGLEAAGYGKVSVYDGSWSEWGLQPPG